MPFLLQSARICSGKTQPLTGGVDDKWQLRKTHRHHSPPPASSVPFPPTVPPTPIPPHPHTSIPRSHPTPSCLSTAHERSAQRCSLILLGEERSAAVCCIRLCVSVGRRKGKEKKKSSSKHVEGRAQAWGTYGRRTSTWFYRLDLRVEAMFFFSLSCSFKRKKTSISHFRKDFTLDC